MASKRVLYKPAPQQKVGQKKSRKPLAQGRLVSQSVAPSVVPGPILQGTVQDGDPTREGKRLATPRSGKVGDATLTPRRLAPNVTLHQSPRLAKPIQTLDLSDTDLDSSQQKSFGDRSSKHKDVVIVDASRQTKGPDQSEVDIVVGIERSPVRVICHSPSVVHSGLRGTGNVAEARNVPVLSLPSVIVEDDQRGVICGRLNFDDSDEVQSVISDSDICSLNEYVTPSAQKLQCSALSNKTLKSETPKKKKVRIIPSRYMQAAVAKSRPDPKMSVSSFQSSSSKKSADRTRSTRAASSRSMDIGHSTKQPQKKSHVPESRDQDKENEVHTPDNSQSSAGGKTSTPTMDGSLFPQDIDASAIHADVSIMSTGEIIKAAAPSSSSKARYKTVSNSLLSDTILQGSAKKKKPKLSQSDLDLLYARYLQWVYLSACASKNLHDQETSVMTQIHALHDQVDKLHSRKSELEQQLAELTHLNLLEQQIDIQRQGLGPVVHNLPKLSEEYRSLANALDTTRHQIPTKGVHLPDDEDQFQATLENALAESEHLLGELSVMIRKDVPHVSSMSTALNCMEKAVDEQCQELSRCREMISATQSLVTQETTLQVQAIHGATS